MTVQKKLLRDLTKSELKLLNAINDNETVTLQQAEAALEGKPAIAMLAELKRLGFVEHPVTGDQNLEQQHLYEVSDAGATRLAEYAAGEREPLRDPTLRDEKLPDEVGAPAAEVPKGLNKARAALEKKDAERRKSQQAAKGKKKPVAARVDPNDEG